MNQSFGLLPSWPGVDLSGPVLSARRPFRINARSFPASKSFSVASRGGLSRDTQAGVSAQPPEVPSGAALPMLGPRGGGSPQPCVT